jgi:RNA polymerase sigma-70 factor, ECF subfamily
MEAARIIGGLARLLRDIGLAEDAAQDALIAALEQWPVNGIPPNPGAWLTATAKHKAIDRLRRDQRFALKLEEIGRDGVIHSEQPTGHLADDDNILRLIFIACHPILPHEAQIALTLRCVCGLTTSQIARAQMSSDTTIQQRITRAKRKLGVAGIDFDEVDPKDRAARLDAVLQVIYLIYNEGYAASSGDSYLRQALTDEALRLGRMLAALIADDSEVHSLLALMELQSSRSRARVGAEGQPVALPDQNRRLWDRLQIARGLKAFAAAEALPGAPGIYYLQAAIAACNARSITAEATDWPQVAALYDVLYTLTNSPVVGVNRAVATGMAHGPDAGLALLWPLQTVAALKSYYPFWAARGELLSRADRPAEAQVAFQTAAAMTRNHHERDTLLRRAERCG